MVALPVYYSWSFGTAEEGNFESLARKLRPAVAPPGVGRRRVDATHPWPGLGARRRRSRARRSSSHGPVVSPQKPETEPARAVADRGGAALGAGGDRDACREAQSRRRAGARAESGPAARRSAAVRRHARTPAAHRDAKRPRCRAQPPWFRELNLDPRHRIVAGLGTRVVQAEQEDLMLAAWNQVIGDRGRQPRAAPGAAGQARRRVAASPPPVAPHRRRGGLGHRARARRRCSTSPQRSVWASIESSSLPRAVTAGAFRRLTRVRGPIVRAAVRALAQRAAAGGRADRARPIG